MLEVSARIVRDEFSLQVAFSSDARITCLFGRSGAGKTSISRRVLAEEGELNMSVSMTTRTRRPGERDGVDYHFVDRLTAMFALDNVIYTLRRR